jgi:hypothetical protein
LPLISTSSPPIFPFKVTPTVTSPLSLPRAIPYIPAIFGRMKLLLKALKKTLYSPKSMYGFFPLMREEKKKLENKIK